MNLKKLQSSLRFLFIIPCLFFNSVKAQVSVSGATVGDGTYADLGTAFAAVNGGAQTGASILVSITANIIEPTTATLNANTWKSLTITPAGAFTISGNLATALISLNGASNVSINGLNSGGNSLTIDNTATGATSTILFNNDSKNITVENCTILGSASTANYGTLFFGNGVVSGNDMIKIKSCTIDASTGGNPVNGIYSAGSAVAGQENSTDSILNSSIANYFSATLASSGVNIATGNTNWTISGCRFYQAASRTYTVANTHTAIKVTAGTAHAILNNTIGYSAAAGTGTYTMTGTVASLFIGIDLSVGTAAVSTIQGNTVTATSLTTSSGNDASNGVLCGIRANTGTVNITNNTIGGTTGTDLFTATPSTVLGAVVGINSNSTGDIIIKNNLIGGLTSSYPSSLIGNSVFGISISGVANTISISDNTIGNTTINNIRAGIAGTTAANSPVAGIFFSTTPASSSITNNKIQNLAAFGTNTATYVRGIMTAAGSGNTSPMIITGNIINKLTSNSSWGGAVSAQTAASGITISVGTNDIIADNIISEISLTNISTSNIYAVGIAHANGSNTTIRNNKIFDITNASNSVSPTAPGIVAGILIRTGASGSNLNIYNNMIALGANSTENTAFVGIMGNHGITPDPIDNIYHNTINISGVASSGAQPSFCFLRGDFSATARTATVNIKNNIFSNSRTGGTGLHFAIANNYGATASATGWAVKASNNNILNANPATIGWWTSAKTFATWQGASLSDSTSYSGYAVTFVNPASDLHLNTALVPTIAESRGQTIASVTTDIDGEVRPGPTGSVNGGGTAPDIGADEIDGVFKDIIAPTITHVAVLATCDTANRVLTATIADAGKIPVTGAYQPRVYYRKNKNAWMSSQGALTGGTATNGTWSFTISSASMGGLIGLDTISYFLIAQDESGLLTSSPSVGLVATDVNTVTTAPTSPNLYAIKVSPIILTHTTGAVCDSGKVTMTAAANAGTINWYTVSTGGISQGTGTFFITPQIKVTTLYYIDATGSNGCVSSRTAVTAKVNYSGTGTLTKTDCDSIKWNGKVYKLTGVYKDTIATTAGCDSIVTLNFTIKYSTASTQTIKACDSYTWIGSTYTVSGVYHNTIPNKAGCDSLLTLNLTINHSNTSSLTKIACDSYIWQGATYTASGIYKDTVSNAAGCDSVLTLNLTINHSTASSSTIKACDTYTWQGATYTVSGVYKHTLTNAAGCDSVLTLNLTINHSNTSTQTIKACGPYSWNGAVYNVSGIYKDTIANASGCDSIMTLNLTITHVNATVTLNTNTITADSVADSYQWILCSNNNSPIVGATNQSYTAVNSGSYAVIETKNGCIDTSKCVTILITGIDKNSNELIHVYPNPGTGIYTLALPEQATVKIVSVTGEVVFDEKLSKGNNTIDLQNAANGLYMIHVYTSQHANVLKLIKQ